MRSLLRTAESEEVKFKGIHPFPARMAPSIALSELPSFTATNKRMRVLDPMAGSGTTLVTARYRGHQAYGFDTDPLACLMAETWCANLEENQVRKCAEDALTKARKLYRNLRIRNAYPLNADAETKEFIRYWFDPINRRQLRALSECIGSIKKRTVRNVLWCGFSRLIIAKSRGASWAMDLSHSRPHKVINRPLFRPFSGFLQAINYVIKNAPFNKSDSEKPRVHVRQGDARCLPIEDGSVDMVITSPPYLNAIDYVRCNKFSLVWMGHQITELRRLRAGNIGAEVGIEHDQENEWVKNVLQQMGHVDRLPSLNTNVVARYVLDMNSVLKEIKRVLTPGGRCILVIGDCMIRGVFIRNSMALQSLGERHGLRVHQIKTRDLPTNRRYLPPPSFKDSGEALQTRMRREVVLSLLR